MKQEDIDICKQALGHIPSDDRMIWVRVGMALHARFGAGGFSMWDSWSSRSSKYDPKEAVNVWKSFSSGGIGIGSLFYLAKSFGYKGESLSNQWAEKDEEIQRQEDRKRYDERMKAITKVRSIIKNECRVSYSHFHPYLQRKKIRPKKVLIWKKNENLIVPLFNRKWDVMSIQTIDDKGNKKFFPKAPVSGFFHDPAVRWLPVDGGIFYEHRPEPNYARKPVVLCEGYATGLSILQSLENSFYLGLGQIKICLSSQNMIKIGKKLRKEKRQTLVVADNDEAGRKAAQAIGGPYLIPDTTGWDANDLIQNEGYRYLGRILKNTLSEMDET